MATSCRKGLIRICLFLFYYSSHLLGITFETSKLEDLLPYITPDTLVIFDLDNTLIESTQHLGSPQWGNHIKSKLMAKGSSEQEAEELANKFWTFTHQFITVKLVDPFSVKIIEKIKQICPTIALTARTPTEEMYTLKQLNSLEILLKHPAKEDRINLPTLYPSLFHKGILFSGFNPKGNTLKTYLQTFNFKPKQIIFVDDVWHHVNGVEKVVEQLGMKYVGVRFSAADERVKSFDPIIAEIQWVNLPFKLTDSEAEKLKHSPGPASRL